MRLRLLYTPLHYTLLRLVVINANPLAGRVRPSSLLAVATQCTTLLFAPLLLPINVLTHSAPTICGDYKMYKEVALNLNYIVTYPAHSHCAAHPRSLHEAA